MALRSPLVERSFLVVLAGALAACGAPAGEACLARMPKTIAEACPPPQRLDRWYRECLENPRDIACFSLFHDFVDGEAAGGRSRRNPACGQAIARRSAEAGGWNERISPWNVLASMADDGKGIPKDPVCAVALHVEGCRHKDQFSCVLAADKLRDDPRRSFDLTVLACDAGRAHACVEAGMEHASGGKVVSRDEAKAAAFFQKACALDEAACFELYVAYDTGQGVPRDAARAAELLRKTCEAKRRARIPLPNACPK